MTQKMSILMLVAVCAALAMSSMSVRAETSDHQHGSSNSSPAAGEDAQHAEHKSLYHMKRHIYSHTLASELRRFFDRPVHFVLSSLEETTAPTPITTSTSSTISTNATTANATAIADAITTPTTAASRNSSSLLNQTLIPLINDANSMLFEWINATRSSIPYPNVGVNSTSAVAKRMSLAEMFQYNTSWIIGLAVIATVIGVFFLGCVIVICYTRRPYRRSGKVYEIESTAKKSQKIPQVPTIHPATKTATLTRSKELYY